MTLRRGGAARGRSSRGGGTVALGVRIETHARGRQRERGCQQAERRVVFEGVVPDVDFGLRDESEADVHARVDVGEGVEDVVEDAVGGGGGGDVFAVRVHVADGGEGAGEDGGVEEEARAGGAFAVEEGDAEEELGLEAAHGCEGEVGERGLEGEGGYVGFGAGWEGLVSFGAFGWWGWGCLQA